MASLRTALALTGGVVACLAGMIAWEKRSEAIALAQEVERAPTRRETPPEPGPVPVDWFHPRMQADEGGRRPEPPPPALGGHVSVHISSMPARLCSALDNSGAASRILQELHETLMGTDWETLEAVPGVARGWVIEDQLVLAPGAASMHAAEVRVLARHSPGAKAGREEIPVLYGDVEETPDGWQVKPLSLENPLREPLEVRRGEVRELVRGSVVTFELRDDVRWHPSPGFEDQRLDARDVLFSWSIYSNPEVACDQRRYQFLKVAEAEVLGPHAIRFFLSRQDAWATDDLGLMCLLPSHLYDLSDPDNPDHDPDATRAEQARFVNGNPHNRQWIGLGPYRLTDFGAQAIEAERFEGYFDPARAGYLDEIRWRYVPDAAALQALLEGELDFYDRLTAEQYFGEATASPVFTARLYKGWYTSGSYSYVCWNTLRPQLADAKVRRALSMCFDVDGFLKDVYGGLGERVTGPMPFQSPGYNHEVLPLPFDPPRAAELLAEAGWYDRDGDGWIDKDGTPLVIEYGALSGNERSRQIGLLLQEGLRRVGVDVRLRDWEWGTLSEKIQERSLDAFSQGWLPPLEPDPEQLWHSRWGQSGVKGANYAALRDPVVDALIERGQRELDDPRRYAIWRELHGRLAEFAPYLWLVNPATKFALDQEIHGFQAFRIDPGYSIRRWYLPAGTSGTRPPGEIGHWTHAGR